LRIFRSSFTHYTSEGDAIMVPMPPNLDKKEGSKLGRFTIVDLLKASEQVRTAAAK